MIPQAPAPTPDPITSTDQNRSRAASGLGQIDIDLIRPNPKQPRQHFDEASLFDLANSLKLKGVLQPVLVRPVDEGRFELVVGERRWRAAQQAGLHKIPAVVQEIPEERLLETALIENIQREELNPMDEAQAYRTLLDELGLSQQEVAERVGKQRATVANMIRLLSLAKPVQAMVRSGAISMGHARALASVSEPTRQIALAERTTRKGLSVRQVEELVAQEQVEGPGIQQVPVARRRDPNVVAAEESLQKALGTKVRIVEGRKKGGRLELHFHSQEELSRIYDLILDAVRGREAEA